MAPLPGPAVNLNIVTDTRMTKWDKQRKTRQGAVEAFEPGLKRTKASGDAPPALLGFLECPSVYTVTCPGSARARSSAPYIEPHALP